MFLGIELHYWILGIILLILLLPLKIKLLNKYTNKKDDD